MVDWVCFEFAQTQQSSIQVHNSINPHYKAQIALIYKWKSLRQGSNSLAKGKASNNHESRGQNKVRYVDCREKKYQYVYDCTTKCM